MYIQVGVKLSDGQKKNIRAAVKNNVGLTLRITEKGSDKLLLTKTQIDKLNKGPANISLSKCQLKALKTGGFLPLIPLIIGAITAAGSVAGGASAIAKAVDDNKSAQKRNLEQKRHNLALEKLAKGGGLYLSRGGGMKKYSGGGLYLKKG
jgi:hypothetical protein